MKSFVRKTVAFLAAATILFGMPVSALTFAQCDKHTDGKIDILDLIAAKNLSADDPATYNQAYFDELTQILLGNSETHEDSSSGGQGGSGSGSQSGGGGSAIYLPEIP